MKDFGYIPDWKNETINGSSAFRLISQYKRRVIRSGSRKHKIKIYSGTSSVASSNIGGVLSENGRIYLIPFNSGTTDRWYYINTDSEKITEGYYFHSLGGNSGMVSGANMGGVLAPNGKIWIVPNSQSTAACWHYLLSKSTANSSTALPTYIEHFHMDLPTGTVNQATYTMIDSTDGIIQVASTGSDPYLVLFPNYFTANPSVYKYFQFRYKYISGSSNASNYPRIYFLNSTYTSPNESAAVSGSVLNTTGNWIIVNIDMSSVGSWTTGGNITGFRFDWTQKSGMTYQFDYVALLPNTTNLMDLDLAVIPYRKPNNSLGNSYCGGIYVNNRVYFLPQTTAARWSYIDTTKDRVILYSHGSSMVNNAYNGGVLAPDGKIYLVPQGAATSETWHYIDSTKSPGASGHVVAYTHGSFAIANAYSGGVLAPDGKIYLIPRYQSTSTMWHYIDTGEGGYEGLILNAPRWYQHPSTGSGRVRFYKNSTDNTLIFSETTLIDVSNTDLSSINRSNYLSSASNLIYVRAVNDHSRYGIYQIVTSGSFLSKRRTYGVSHVKSNGVIIENETLSIGFIRNGINGQVVEYSHNLGANTPISNAYISGALAPDGKIYFAPHAQATAKVWHYIDTTKVPGTPGHVVAYSHNTTDVVSGAYAGAVTDSKGRVIFIPYNQATSTVRHYVETYVNVEFQDKMILSPYLNKY